MWNIFLHYCNIAIKMLDAETAAINDILLEFQRPEIVEAMNKLNVSEWAIKLKEENDKFHNLMAARYNEPVGKTAYRMKTARVETDKYYRAMVAHIENLVLADKIKSDDGFNVQLNEVILHFKTILAQEFGRKNKL
jgi:argininosuccinate lyase